MEKRDCKNCGYYLEDEFYCEYWGDSIDLVETCTVPEETP